jgi:hypothetical protein
VSADTPRVQVEFKSLPNVRQNETVTEDPQTSTTILLFEEFVLYE